MFNKKQAEAINVNRGAALVLAGPGSGKTTIITHRIKQLIEGYGVSPDKILVVTFTKAAAQEMQQRFLCLTGDENQNLKTYPVTFGTFHSVFYRIVRLSGNYSDMGTLSEKDKSDILREIILRLRIETTDIAEFARFTAGEISRVKGGEWELEEYEPDVCNKKDFKRIFEEYQKALKWENKVDFDDMLLICHKLLTENEQIRKMWQDRFEYVLIDEFQDINRIQYKNIKILAYPQNNIFVVGDDDQAIYGFRGSNPEIMFCFKEDYKECREIILDTNYRSTPDILEMSYNLISNNKVRFEKRMKASSREQIPIDIRQFRNQFDEFAEISKIIIRYVRNGIKPEDIAILVRNNSQIDYIRNVLLENGIGIQTKNNINNIYNNSVGKDIMAYVNSAVAGVDIPLSRNVDLMRIINKPQRFISRQVMSRENLKLEHLRRVYGHNREIMANINELIFNLEMLGKMEPASGVHYILKGCGYEKYLRMYAKEWEIKEKDLLKIVESVQSDAGRFDTLEEWTEWVNESNLEKSRESGRGVSILTMHGAKGLEYEVVIIPDMNQGLMPSARAIRQEEIEEERRLFYVAMTRAKKYLHIFAMRQNLGNIMEISQFIGEALHF